MNRIFQEYARVHTLIDTMEASGLKGEDNLQQIRMDWYLVRIADRWPEINLPKFRVDFVKLKELANVLASNDPPTLQALKACMDLPKTLPMMNRQSIRRMGDQSDCHAIRLVCRAIELNDTDCVSELNVRARGLNALLALNPEEYHFIADLLDVIANSSDEM